MGALSLPDKEESYFLDSLFQLQDGEVFVDGGAYIGDTAMQVIRRNRKFGKIIAVEADPATFARLCEWISTAGADVRERVVPRLIALGSSRGQLRFKATGTEGACLAPDGDVVVECIPLDELAADRAPTFIKMDIEGAEYDALLGARSTIQMHGPVVAACVYHLQNDLWRIPLLLRKFNPGYRMFLRHHDGDGWQTVCYAVPPHRLRQTAGVLA